jgi:DNA-binding LacI/PurR family transcriptional regulator
MDLTNPFFKLIANIMQEESAKYGYELVALSGNLDPARQNNQLLDLMHPRPESRLYLIKRYMIHHSSSRERWPGARFALLSITWKVKN